MTNAPTTPVGGIPAAVWLQQEIGYDRPEIVDAGLWHPKGGKLFVVDALAPWQPDEPFVVVDAPARVLGIKEPEQGRTAILAVIWSDTPATCGEDLWTMTTMTGTAGFMTPAEVKALRAYADVERTAYYGSYAEQLDATLPTPPLLAELPTGERFPVCGSGWGNGAYPVCTLKDTNDALVAMYMQFTGGTDTWLLPEPCRT